MPFDIDKINKYLKEVRQIQEILDENQELLDPEKLYEFRQISSALEQNAELARSESRKLSIGIVGAVKAGKSSFLNACLFKGENYLPKAATPMTAALTKITYSEAPKAIIHFYTKEDWHTIEEQARKYDEELEKQYNKYCEDNLIKMQSGLVFTNTMSLEEFERGYKTKVSENLQGSKELMKMASDPSLMEKLGSYDEIEGDIITKLNDYVGAGGHYTPIVSYVELQTDNPSVKDYEIVDTPGLNDPIVSRGVKTKQFLRKCDVVILLSPCSQFMDANTVQLMAKSLPDAGVREILVVGSKFDSGILNEKTKNFGYACSKSLASYKTQFENNLTAAKSAGKHLDILNKMNVKDVLFISSTCFAINEKLKSGKELDDSEQTVYNNLHKYEDFDDGHFSSISGINKVKIALNEVGKKKEKIIEGKDSELLRKAKDSHLRVFEAMLQETTSSRSQLETTTREELKQRISLIRDVIDSSRTKLMNAFDRAAIECEAKVNRIKPELTVALAHHQNIDINTSQRDEFFTERCGFLGLKRRTIHYTITEHSADVDSVIKNINGYSAECHSYINNEFENLLNREKLIADIKEILLSAFGESRKDFDESDILDPTRNVLAKISIPCIAFNCTPYIDELSTRFSGGSAKNEDISKLKILQANLFNKIEIDVVSQLTGELEKITGILKTQAVTFADKIEKDFCKESEKLQTQVDEKDRYIEKYNKFSENLREMKNKLKEYLD